MGPWQYTVHWYVTHDTLDWVGVAYHATHTTQTTHTFSAKWHLRCTQDTSPTPLQRQCTGTARTLHRSLEVRRRRVVRPARLRDPRSRRGLRTLQVHWCGRAGRCVACEVDDLLRLLLLLLLPMTQNISHGFISLNNISNILPCLHKRVHLEVKLPYKINAEALPKYSSIQRM